MAEIIDLDILVSEDISFKIGGEIYKVPTSYNTETVLKMYHLQQEAEKVKKTNNVENGFELQDKMVYLLLSELNDIDELFVRKLHVTQKTALLNYYQNRMIEINSNPNSNSLPSQQQ
ncbi:hypothetical protein ABC255_08780 [Neobacillus sp. 3P2-tot-E-2]|uniref:hypothetical protein n=1 Tax=Neobacillus sp. 3P2-tot-E-2 TaxID=3132212 RepID=UPI0039A3B1A8